MSYEEIKPEVDKIAPATVVHRETLLAEIQLEKERNTRRVNNLISDIRKCNQRIYDALKKGEYNTECRFEEQNKDFEVLMISKGYNIKWTKGCYVDYTIAWK